MKTGKKQAHTKLQKKALIIKLGERLGSLKNYFAQAAKSVISAIKNFTHHKDEKVVNKPVIKKAAKKKPNTAATHKTKTATAKKKVARVKGANNINIYA